MAGDFGDLLAELFAPLGRVSLRRMFGGIGISKNAIMFGLVAGDILYLKADETTRLRFEAEGCGP
jgi:DNA transformation protein